MHQKIKTERPLPRQFQTLDDLFAWAGNWADYCMRDTGEMRPTLFILGENGPEFMVYTRDLDEAGKNALAATAQLFCIANAATAACLASEAWSSRSDGGTIDITDSDAAGRREVIVMLGETREGRQVRQLDIVRSDNGKFFNLADSVEPQPVAIEGRFARLLPDTNLSTPFARDLRVVARSMLESRKGLIRMKL